MRLALFSIGLCAITLVAGCSQPAPSAPVDSPVKQPVVVPPEISSVAQGVLGAEAEVLVYGDLALNGHRQVLAISRMPKTPTGAAPGILLTRAVIAEESNGKWREVFRCDEHLKNANGYLGGTPIAPVTGWRLQYEQDPQKGLQLYYTPMQQADTVHPIAIGVRWDPAAKRYRSLDRNYENFLAEIPALEVPNSRLR